MKRLLCFLLLISSGTFAQTYEVKIMSWNVLNWPSNSNLVTDTTDRCPSYREVINHVKPDLLVTMENTSNNSAPWFLDQVMNTGSYHYASGTFINGYDTDNALFYRDSLFDFISNVPVHTSLRDISHFTVRFKATGDTLHIFSLHLKASQGFETQRAGEIADLRAVTNAFPEGTNFLVAGDFNIYNDTEPAYTGLLLDNPNDDGHVNDVINLTGTWNNYNYRAYHTQSTHVNSTGGFSGGGLDDRFDMILYSNGVKQPSGVYFIPGSYVNVGNDGHHYGDDINYGTNTAVPVAVADALFNTSDHLPITMNLRFGVTSGIDELSDYDVNIFPNPVTENSRLMISLNERSKVSFSISDNLGKVIASAEPLDYDKGEHFMPFDLYNLQNAGFYFLSVKINNALISKKLIVIK